MCLCCFNVTVWYCCLSVSCVDALTSSCILTWHWLTSMFMFSFFALSLLPILHRGNVSACNTFPIRVNDGVAVCLDCVLRLADVLRWVGLYYKVECVKWSFPEARVHCVHLISVFWDIASPDSVFLTGVFWAYMFSRNLFFCLLTLDREVLGGMCVSLLW